MNRSIQVMLCFSKFHMSKSYKVKGFERVKQVEGHEQCIPDAYNLLTVSYPRKGKKVFAWWAQAQPDPTHFDWYKKLLLPNQSIFPTLVLTHLNSCINNVANEVHVGSRELQIKHLIWQFSIWHVLSFHSRRKQSTVWLSKQI